MPWGVGSGVRSLGWERHAALAASIGLVSEMAVAEGATEARGPVMLSEEGGGSNKNRSKRSFSCFSRISPLFLRLCPGHVNMIEKISPESQSE